MDLMDKMDRTLAVVLGLLVLIFAGGSVLAVTENTPEGFLNMTGLMDTDGHTLDVNADGSLPITGATSTGSDTGAFSFVSQHTSYSNGLTDEEIYRTSLRSGDSLAISKVEVRPKGGGSDTASVDVYDATAGTVIASQQGGGVTYDPGASGGGNTVLFRVSNNTGSAVVWSITIQGRIK